MKARRTFNFWYFINHDLKRIATFTGLAIAMFLLTANSYNLATSMPHVTDLLPFFKALGYIGIVSGTAYFAFFTYKAFQIIRRSGK
ncbi:MAG: hypothetical protein M9949_04885 [Candidatus Kapabacteria bacterium]|nr:hypothetical protein [Candidatus Kapabacteria bacterium]